MSVDLSNSNAAKSGGTVSRAAGDVANTIGLAYIGLIAGSWLGTLLFKMRVLGFWDGSQDFIAGFYNPLELLMRVIALGPGLIAIWIAGWLERRSVSRGKAVRSDEVRFRVPSIVATTLGVVLTILAAVILVIDNPPNPYRYAAYQCSGTNCRDHEAGYAWAAEQAVFSSDDCAVDRSRTFREGCRYYVERTLAAASGEE
ncbi:hypothetical protein [Brevundimonas sp. AAP58]|uniref:hypothetical protein n=1 Tax=Brevundimonas sp. AAP58 TaxID=1523422 RepID=UPI0012E1A3D8|nr:hypothetical protein [Brevundimonas sp. AAP58]